jgi:ArsR family transcriptional regulator, arsenate/arsenite/antimonite-responsive transcriptional repressor
MDASTALDGLSALGQESRLRIFRYLVRRGAAGAAAGTIAAELDIVPNTLSAHLGQLARAGLIKGARDGRSIRYAADYDGIATLLTYLMEDCCQGQPELCRPAVAALACAC